MDALKSKLEVEVWQVYPEGSQHQSSIGEAIVDLEKDEWNLHQKFRSLTRNGG